MRETTKNYHNERACLNPQKFVKQQCTVCMFFDGCVLPDKLIGYKGGKPILYKDTLPKEDE